ncbi:hypothetical protein BS47DRAFT_634037 [Hydnum rufescens UP504]|uniref:Uncharacterized protein n=1 Tax=Hydnum rufescens UP504 TaxID=1448309 RepID=A0A9P6BAJ0_9AGAM|nr:hypothetical protein BS47DRAFT_634037 [Hydnum rufescens UP504]
MISRSEYLSSLLGYVSLGSWLGAQFPQLLANARLQSVEHLALPFLVNWLFGDITNLVGCLLTNQLPFQTWVATYFCSIDICLFAQYIYYSQPRFRKPKPSPAILPTSSYTHSQSRSRTYSSFSDRPTIGSVKQRLPPCPRGPLVRPKYPTVVQHRWPLS